VIYIPDPSDPPDLRDQK